MIDFYLDIAQKVMQNGNCSHRNFGAIIVKNNEIISEGYSFTIRRNMRTVEEKNSIKKQIIVVKKNCSKI